MEKYNSRDVQGSESYIGVDGIIKLGSQVKKRHRFDKHNSIKSQIDALLKKEFIKPVKKIYPAGWETLMAMLCYESEPPMLLASLDKPPEDDRTFALKSAKKEGIRFIYERLEKLSKEVEEEKE